MTKTAVARPKKKAVVKSLANLPAVKPWKNSTDLLADINANVERFQKGIINCEQARLIVQSHRNAVAILALQLEHARQTKRLIEQDQKLPGFEIAK